VKEPNWVDQRVALAIHARLLVLHGGAQGLRDEGLLQAALARPRQLFAYAESPSLIEMAAAYTVGIVRNHPFLDGNKRTGFVVGVLFLETNGCRFTAPEEDATRAVLDLAAGLVDEKGFVAWLKNHVRVRRKPTSK
jgi:death-on-curing protein